MALVLLVFGLADLTVIKAMGIGMGHVFRGLNPGYIALFNLLRSFFVNRSTGRMV